MKLVDAEKVIAQEKYYAEKYKGDFGEQVSSHTIEILDSAPTVDAVLVIRCRDCKHWQYESCFVESEEGDAGSIILDRFAFDFCSRAERRNDETD